MVLNGLSIFSLEKDMREEEHRVMKPWYTGDAALMGPVEQNVKILCALV